MRDWDAISNLQSPISNLQSPISNLQSQKQNVEGGMARRLEVTGQPGETSALGRLLTWRQRRLIIAFLFVLPALVNFAVFRYIPIAEAFRASLYQYSLLGGYGDFVGMTHYTRMLTDPVFWRSLQASALFVLYKVPLQIVLSLGLAILLTRQTIGTAIVRSAILTPMVTSIIIVSIIWAMMYQSQNGLFQSVLVSMGLRKIAFLSDARYALPAVSFMMIWKDIGFSFIIFVAGLKGIPEMYYEAAIVDGATRWQLFRHITVPLLKPVLMFVIVTQTIFSFQVFVPVYQMTLGGPLDSTKVLVFYIYQQGFRLQDMGYASAISIVTLVLLLLISWVQMRFLRTDD
jgi:ABC-type sugar transport system permease subunit